MDFDRYKEINDKRLNYREMEDASVVSTYRNVGCGDGYRIFLKVNEGNYVTDASYTTTGCGFGLVALAMATEFAKNRHISEVKNVTEEDIEKLFEFPERRKLYPKSAVEALQKAIYDFENGGGIPREKRVTAEKVYEILEKKGDLIGEDLSSVILEGREFKNINFSNANLSHAFLQNNDFEGANFENAKLRGAFLNNSNLTNANFKNADLRWVKLTGVKLEGVDFSGALYDIGTRVDAKNIHIFEKMKKVGKDSYTTNHEEFLQSQEF